MLIDYLLTSSPLIPFTFKGVPSCHCEALRGTKQTAEAISEREVMRLLLFARNDSLNC